MAFEYKLSPRPYSDDEAKSLLKDVVSVETTDWHYNTHHKGYVTVLNKIEQALDKADPALANGNHSARAGGDSGRTSIMRGGGSRGGPLRFVLVSDRARSHAKFRGQGNAHQSCHDPDERIVMNGVGDGIHDFPTHRGG